MIQWVRLTNNSLDWLEKKTTEYLIIHRHEVKGKIRAIEITLSKKHEKLERINELLEKRKNNNERLFGSG